jgi:HAD superfamily hydrolase (TIGR01509 family)
MNLIFDFDGTICDSLSIVEKILKKSFPELNDPPFSTAHVREIGTKELIKRSKLPKHKIPSLLTVGRREMSKYIPKLKSFPHLKTVLKTLSKNHSLSILTTNSVENVQSFLYKNKLDKFFKFIHSELAFLGKHRKLKKVISKYHLDPQQTLYIGDETRDIEAAKKAGIKSVAVTWGYEARKLLKHSNPNVIVSNPRQLLDL